MNAPLITTVGLLAAALTVAACAPAECGDDLPIRRLTGEISMWRGTQALRDDGTKGGCIGWTSGEELYDYRYRLQWGVGPNDGGAVKR